MKISDLPENVGGNEPKEPKKVVEDDLSAIPDSVSQRVALILPPPSNSAKDTDFGVISPCWDEPGLLHCSDALDTVSPEDSDTDPLGGIWN